HHDQEQGHPGDRRNRLQDDDGRLQNLAEKEQHPADQAEAHAEEQCRSVSEPKADQAARQACAKVRSLDVVPEPLEHPGHVRHQEIRQKPGGDLPEQQNGQHRHDHGELLSKTGKTNLGAHVGSKQSGRSVPATFEKMGSRKTAESRREARLPPGGKPALFYSLRVFCHSRSMILLTSKALPSRVFSEPCSCMMSAISCMRASSLSVRIGLKVWLLMASRMMSSRGSSPCLSVLSEGSAMK